jgi:Sucrase/ferredoxin-like
MASAPEASRAWLLIEHPGPWPPEPVEAELPAPLHVVAAAAVGLGIRVQLIRRPAPRAEPGPYAESGARRVFVGWTAGSQPWLRHGEVASGPSPQVPWSHQTPPTPWPPGLDLDRLAAGDPPSFGSPASEPVFLVCGHGQRNACCARFGVPLARQLAARYPGQVFQTTHVGGHRFAANLVILPHGLYYGPVGMAEATAAISAYQHGQVTPERYRGRAGQPRSAQQEEHDLLTRAGSLAVAALA